MGQTILSECGTFCSGVSLPLFLDCLMYLNRKRESVAHRHCHFFVAGTLLMVPLSHPLQILASRDVLG